MAGRRIIVDILGDASQFTKATQQATSSAGKFKNVMTGIGVGIGAGFTQMAGQAAGAVVDFVKDSITAASDLNETMTKSEVIFGKGSDAVKNWAEQAVDSMGLSTRAALDAASGFAGLFKTVGIVIDEATAMSQDITQLGADLASFFNTDMATALAALKSGLSGESEPLRQFNVFLSETAVSAKLAQMGIKKVGGQFTEAQKATARYQLILEQTSDAQGDYQRTSDGLANTQRGLDAEMENLSAELGQTLLPLATKLTKWAKNDAVPALGDLVDTFADLTDEGSDFSKIMSDVMNSFDPKPAYEAKTALGEADEALSNLISDTIDFVTPWDTFESRVDEGARKITLFGETVEGIPPLMDRGAESAGTAMGMIRDSVRVTAEDGHRSVQAMKTDWRNLANYLLGKFNSDFDKAMDIREARQALTTAKTREDKVRAYQDLAALGAVSAQDYDNWLATLKEMSANAKGRVKDNIDAAIANLRRLRDVANRPIVQRFVMSYTGKALPGGDGLPGRASGGPASGLTWVGEQGPELVSLPRGSYVNDAQKSKTMAQGTGIVVNVAGSIIGPSGIDELANMLAYRLKLDGV